jgi:hypothetical protein
MAVYLNLELENTVDIEKDDYLVLCFLNCSCFLLTHEDFCSGRDSQLARPLNSIFFLANKIMPLGHELLITLSYPISNKKKSKSTREAFFNVFRQKKAR